METVVLYFSRSGKTKSLAQGIALETKAETEEIRLKKVKNQIPSTGTLMAHRRKSKPAIYHENTRVDRTQTVFLGGPVWGGMFAPPVLSTVEAFDWKQKRVFLFASQAFFGGRKALTSLKASLESQGAKVLGTKVFTTVLRNPESLKNQGIKWSKTIRESFIHTEQNRRSNK